MNAKTITKNTNTKIVNGVKTTVTTITTKEGNKTSTQVITTSGDDNHDDFNFDDFGKLNNFDDFKGADDFLKKFDNIRRRSSMLREEEDNDQDDKDVNTNDDNSNDDDGSSIHDFIQGSLKKHNYFRALHGVPNLIHNAELSKLSQSYAEKLASNDSFEHSNCKWGTKKVGENLFMCGGYKCTPEMSSQNWYDEITDYDFNKSEFSSDTGHFTQLIWKSSKEVGFGLAQSKRGNWYSVANYYPPGNYLGKFKDNVFPSK